MKIELKEITIRKSSFSELPLALASGHEIKKDQGFSPKIVSSVGLKPKNRGSKFIPLAEASGNSGKYQSPKLDA